MKDDDERMHEMVVGLLIWDLGVMKEASVDAVPDLLEIVASETVSSLIREDAIKAIRKIGIGPKDNLQLLRQVIDRVKNSSVRSELKDLEGELLKSSRR